MSLQIFNGTGQPLLDTADRLSRVHGRYTVVAGENVHSGFVAVPGMVDDNSWYCFSNTAEAGVPQPIFMGITNGGFNWYRWGKPGPLSEIVTVMRV